MLNMLTSTPISYIIQLYTLTTTSKSIPYMLNTFSALISLLSIIISFASLSTIAAVIR